MEAWQKALDRQKEREEAAVEEAEDHVEEEDVVEDEEKVVDEGEGARLEDESKSKDEEMEVDKETENAVGSSNGYEANTAKGNTENGHSSDDEMFKCIAFCKGFTDEDCDVEEYFDENHESVEQVWQRGEGDGCEVYVKFKDEIAVQRFLTLNYVRYRSRPITVSTVKEKGDLAEYLTC